jgi:nucleoside diphosphate kinase
MNISVRALYGSDLVHNSIYGSPTVEDAIREIQIVFPRGIRQISDRRSSVRSASRSLGGAVEQFVNNQRTLALIKPDAYGAGKKEEIIEKLKEAGFKIAIEKEIQLTEDMAKRFYAEHAEKPFYSELVSWMSRYICDLQITVRRSTL